MKLLIAGGNGQVATEYQMSDPLPGWEFQFVGRQELDISNTKKVAAFFKKNSPDAVLNLAAHTNVEKAEKEETEKAFNVNATGAKNLALACNAKQIPLIHLSTDYVFDGKSEIAYRETDLENPLNHYGRTKFLGEQWIRETHDWYYIIRVAWVYSNHSKNFFNTMLGLAQERSEISVVEDQYGSPTSAKEICRAIDSILTDLKREKSGTYHFSGLGRTSWKDFAIEIFSQTKVAVKVNGVPTSSWPSKASRPVNSYMSSEKFSATFGYFPAHWKNALREVVSERKVIPVKVGDVAAIEGEPHIVVSTDWLKRVASVAHPSSLEKTIEIPFDSLRL